MRFEDRITRAPRVFEPARTEDVLAQLPWVVGRQRDVIAGTAGCSPYLADLMVKEAGWLEAALEHPEQAANELIADVRALTLDQLADGLRQGKRRIALLTGLADVGGVWGLSEVTQRLTDFASAAVHQCITQLVAAEIKRGKLPSLTEADAETAGGMSVMAMGKMGAGELNYSSDIDLICLFDETRFDPDDYHDARAAFIRVTRKMTALMSDVKSGGYVFRTDLRLRPDASVTPVCLSMEAAERYYESVGRTWERAAYIKATPAAGDIAAGERFLKTLRPFVWRKHLDFAAIQDAHDMRLRIKGHKGLGGKLSLEGHNMKLGRGGIREIEFFTQTRQLIAGGRDPSLRVKGTIEGLGKLAASNWVSEDEASVLGDHYTRHREIEHRLQMVRDAQTHHLPADPVEFDRLAAFLDIETSDLRDELEERLEDVHARTEGFFAPGAGPQVDESWGRSITSRWPKYPALRSERAGEIFNRLWPEILAKLQEAAKPDEALHQFDQFLSGLPAGVQLFSLFEANPELTKLIVDIAATAPALSRYLSQNAGVFDAVIAGSFFSEWPERQGLAADLTEKLDEADDYESKLIATRKWANEWHFRIGVHKLRGIIDAKTSGRQYSDLADAVIETLWPVVVAEFARKHGDPPGNGAVILGMGSLGAGQLNAMSDLDLIMIYDAAGETESDGKRPLATRLYYARLTQALVTALSAQMADGRLYEVDMRLRPSGRQGPVATSIESFENYQLNEAWTWEHLALTRARVIAGPKQLRENVAAIRRTVLTEKAAGKTISQDVQDMRARLEEAKASGNPWDMKTGAGRLQDIELIAQACALFAGSFERLTTSQIAVGVADGQMTDADAQTLIKAADLMWQVQSAGRLLTGGILDPEAIGEGGRRLVLRDTGFETMDALENVIANAALRAEKIITTTLGAMG